MIWRRRLATVQRGGWRRRVLTAESLEARQLLAGDAAAAGEKAEGLAIVTTDAFVDGNDFAPVASFVDVLIEAPFDFSAAASGYEIDLSFVGAPTGLRFTSASAVPFGDPLFVGQTPITLGIGESLQATDFLNSGTATLADGKALLRAHFTVDVGVSGVFDLAFDPVFTTLVDRNAQPFALSELRGGTVVVGVGQEVQLSVADAQAIEGDSGVTNMLFTVQLSAAAASDVQIDYFTTSQTAISGQDYNDAVSTLIIPAGQTTAQIAVEVLGDTIVEPDETFVLTLANPVGVSVVDGAAIGTILDDDVIGTQPPWQFADNPLDVNANGSVTPQDVIILINEINANGSRTLPTPDVDFAPPPYLDPNGDGAISPADVIAVVNFLNGQSIQARQESAPVAVEATEGGLAGVQAADAAVALLFDLDEDEA